jgi:hypothetical protein
MITPPSDHGQPVPPRESGTIVRLVEHTISRTRAAAPPGKPARSTRQDGQVDTQLLRQPTAAESYGCVDWFQF